MFHISVVNRTRTISDLELHRVVRAINRQIAEDFAPYWAFGGVLRVEGPARGRIDSNALLEMRGDAVLYLLDSATSDDALGYHDRNMQGVPYGFVYLDLCAQLGDPWSVTLSHEALELVADPQCNLLVKGPHPRDRGLPDVYHYFEMCDAVQAQVYEIDGVPVSNFVLPAYFSPNESEGSRKDFSGTGLRSFGVNPGGYIGFFDPSKSGGSDDTYWADAYSEQRYAIKSGSALPPSEQPRGRLVRRHGAGQEVQGIPPAAAVTPGVAHAFAATAASPQVDPIRHLVVLMLENRSFDHVLGGLQGAIPCIDGVANPGSNVDRSTGKPVMQAPVALDTVSAHFKVPHEFDDVQEQLSGGGANFVNNFVRNNPDSTAAERAQVMAYFKDGDLPVLHTLAKHFLVCNRWFSSLPGPTWPNRVFVHSGTSLGHVDMPDADHIGDVDQLWHTYTQDTIYDRLDQANVGGKPVPWRIYHDGIPQSILLDHLKMPFVRGRYGSMADFINDAKTESSFPAYAFIEPRYYSAFGQHENDQHAPAGMAAGEALIASVYDAIRSNPDLWRSTLLVITYDEHGGFYDHVTPPAAVPPDANVTGKFGFDRLGVRVPAILVSPYVKSGCDDTVYDHTSILRYLLEKYGLPPLGNRTRLPLAPNGVGNFAAQLQAVARDDTPPPFAAVHAMGMQAQAAAPAATPDNTQRLMLAIGERLRMLDQLTRRGAMQAPMHLPDNTPRDADGFTRRAEDVERWIATAVHGDPAPAPVQAPPGQAAHARPAKAANRKVTSKTASKVAASGAAVKTAGKVKTKVSATSRKR